MRVDVRDIDDAINMQRCAICKVFLNGVEQRFCIAADDQQGIIERYRLDENGKIIINRQTNIALTETVKGIVCIKLNEGVR